MHMVNAELNTRTEKAKLSAGTAVLDNRIAEAKMCMNWYKPRMNFVMIMVQGESIRFF